MTALRNIFALYNRKDCSMSLVHALVLQALSRINTMKSTLIVCTAFFAAAIVQAQSKVTLHINHFLGDESFEIGKTVSSEDDLDLNVSRLEYYLSKMSIVHDGGKVSNAESIYALVNADSATNIDLGEHEFMQIEAINFSVGVDPDNNHLDPALWPESHPLAPKDPSMHWGWTAGYRFVAFEGKAGASLSTRYEFHALGDKNYYHYSVPVKATESEGNWTVELNADYLKGLTSLNLEEGLIKHGEDGEAAILLNNFWNLVFESTEGEGNVLEVNDALRAERLVVYPNPTTGMVLLPQKFRDEEASLTIINASGQVVTKTQVQNLTGGQVYLHQPGLYRLVLTSGNGEQSTASVVVQ